MSHRRRTPLIGREDELAGIVALLGTAGCRLFTLTGSPGTGKTRLADELAFVAGERLGRHASVVALADIRDPDAVVPTIAAALGVQEQADRTLYAGLVATLSDGPQLLVLDNFEQLLATSAIVGSLLSDCVDLRILVTSRARLHLHDEREYALAPLALPDPRSVGDLSLAGSAPAVRLFVERARLVDPAFQLTSDNIATVADICVRLDGLPLAIELAAVRLKMLTLAMLRDRLERPLAMLTYGSRDLPARHRTIRAAIGSSYDLLMPGEQRLFRRLAAFSGGWSLEAVEDVCSSAGDSVSILDRLAALIDASLVIVDRNDAIARYHLLETIREFASEQLVASGDLEAVHAQHTGFYLALAEDIAARLGRDDDVRLLAQLDADYPNLRLALERAIAQSDADVAQRLASALGEFWFSRARFSEGGALLESALALDTAPTLARARELEQAGKLRVFSDLAAAQTFLNDSLKITSALGDSPGRLSALMSVGNLFMSVRDTTLAREHLEEALTVSREIGDDRRTLEIIYSLSGLYLFNAEYQAARIVGEEAVAISRRLRDKRRLAVALYMLGYAVTKGGDPATARPLLEESLRLCRAIDAPWDSAQACWELGEVARIDGRYDDAKRFYAESTRAALEQQVSWASAASLETFAYLAHAEGHTRHALFLLAASTAHRERVAAPFMPMDLPEYQQHLELARERLEGAAYAAAWTAGSLTPVSDAVLTELACAAPAPAGPVPSQNEPRPAENTPVVLQAVASQSQQTPELTRREFEILQLIVAGHSNKQIAEQLFLSVRTVERHIANIYAKLGARRRSEVIAIYRWRQAGKQVS